MDNKLLFTKSQGKKCVVLIQDGKLKAVSLQGEHERITNGIYIARIKDISNELHACFVEIAKNQVCFLPFSEMEHPFIISDMKQSTNIHRPPKQGDLILVQGIKEAQKSKQATVTAKLAISDKYFVVSLGSAKTCFSSKLSPLQRQLLKQKTVDLPFFDQDGNLNDWNNLELPVKQLNIPFPSVGVLFRTESINASTRELLDSLQNLLIYFREMLINACYLSAFSCLQPPPSPWLEALNNFARPSEYDEILTDDKALYEDMQKHFSAFPTDKSLRFYNDSYPLEKLYSLQSKIQTCLSRKIWMKSGAYLIIDLTEALTVIDVNSGKHISSKENQAFYKEINFEAADEIATLLRLRNLTGMILVDFINMKDPDDQKELIKYMSELLKKDVVSATILDFTKLGLMEITRARNVPPLLEQAIYCGYPLSRK